MADRKVTCDVHFSMEAVEWCSTCEQSLCTECTDYHSKANLSKTHTTIPMEDYKKLPPVVKSLKKKCEKHDKRLEFYCPTHENIICLYCLQLDHRNCTDTEALERAVSNVKSSSAMDDIQCGIADLKMNLQLIINDRIENISRIDKDKINCVTVIRKTKQKLVKYLDELEKMAIDNVNEVLNTQKSSLDKQINELRKKKFRLERISSDLFKISKFASEIDTFIFIKNTYKEISNEEKDLNSLIESENMSNYKIGFQLSENAKSFENQFSSFGQTVIVSEKKPIRLKQTKKKQAQTFCSENENKALEQSQQNTEVNNTSNSCGITRKYTGQLETKETTMHSITESPQNLLDKQTNVGELEFNVKVKYNRRHDIPGNNNQITACKMLSNDWLVFVDHRNHQLILLDNFEVSMIDLAAKPIDITCLDISTVAVTSYNDNTVFIIDITTHREIKKLHTRGRCFGIDYNHGKLFISLPDEKRIQVIDIENAKSECESFIKTKHGVFYLACSDDNIYCTNYKTSCVFCISTSGNVLWEIQNLMDPLCVSLDSKRNIYVSCRKLNAVVLISCNGSKQKTLLRHVTGIKYPRAIDISITTSTFLLCDENFASYVVYDLQLNQD